MTKQDLRDIFFRNNYDEYRRNKFCKGGCYTLRHGEYGRMSEDELAYLQCN